MFGRPEYEYEYEYLYSTKNYIGVGLQERTSLPADAGFSRRTSHTYTFNPNHKGNMKIISSEQTLSCNKEARQLAQEICPLAEVTTKQVFSRQRFDEVALTRQIIMTILINRGWSLNQVGRTFLRHHGTVIHAKRAVANRYQRDRFATQLINRLANNGIPVLNNDQEA